MSLGHLLALFLLLPSIVTPTSLSSNNCPSNFNIASANTSLSSSLQPLTNLLYSNLYSANAQASIQASFTSGNTSTINNQLTYLPILIPFAALASIFGLTFIIALCCCIFQKSCPPCQSWRRDFSTRPYQKSQLKCVMIFALVFAFGTAVTTIIGFVFFPQLKTYITNTKCALYTSLDVALNGDQTNGWGGFSQLTNQIGNVSTLLSTASTAVTTNLSNNGWLLTSLTALKEQNLNLYTNNYQSTVLSPNPTTTQTAISGSNPLPTVTPLFISQGLGPNGTNATMVTDIDSGLQVTGVVAAQGYAVYTSGVIMTNSANTITTNLNLALQAMTLNANYLGSIQVSIGNFSSAIFDNLFNWGLYLIQGILGFILAASLLLILGIIATHWFQLYSCKTSVHLGWVAFGITYFGVIALTFIFFSFGGISYQFCQFYGSILNSNSSFSAYAQVTGPSQFNRFFQKLNTCFYGNGSIMNSFSISQEMQTVSGLYAQINTFLNMMNPSTALYVNTSYSLSKITGWMNAMQEYSLGIYIDAASALTSQDNPQVALAGMNKYTNNGTGGNPPSCTNDYWVFDNTNCTHNSTETIYVSNNSTSGTSFASTGTMCISFNQLFQSQNSYRWTVADIANRYLSRRECNANTQTYTQIINYASSLVNYRDSRINLYQNLQNQLNSLLTANNLFNSNLTSFTTKLNSFLTTTSTLNSLVTNAANGLDASSNCTTIANNLRFLYNSFCVNFLYTSVQFGICCLTLLAIMIGGTLTGCVFATRYARVEKDMKAIRPQTPTIQQLHSQTFQKRHSSSSSSSDED